MPLPAHLLDQLATHLLLAVDPVQGKPVQPRDIIGLRGWLHDLIEVRGKSKIAAIREPGYRTPPRGRAVRLASIVATAAAHAAARQEMR